MSAHPELDTFQGLVLGRIIEKAKPAKDQGLLASRPAPFPDRLFLPPETFLNNSKNASRAPNLLRKRGIPLLQWLWPVALSHKCPCSLISQTCTMCCSSSRGWSQREIGALSPKMKK